MSATGTLQGATVIAKTTQTLIGQIIGVEGYSYITFYFTYTKGDESGLLITPWCMRTVDGTAYQIGTWTGSSQYTLTPFAYKLSATTSGVITLDVEGLDYVKFTQGGSNDDGTPTGTLAASYTLK